jgi:hypothetical protein
MASRNITLSIPDEELQRAKVIAAQQGTSLSQLLTEMIKSLADRDTGYSLARARSIATLEHGLDLGSHGQISWSREELHER